MLVVVNSETSSVNEETELLLTRHQVRTFAVECGMNLVEQTKIMTAAGEIARNMLLYAGGGSVVAEIVARAGRNGVRVTCSDRGPGIADVEKAMTDGFSTRNSLGLGLPGARRLVHEFEIESVSGQGTRIVLLRWRL
jgi:serine/threonine-protein kinase RsbT